jgi:hypothetical protein
MDDGMRLWGNCRVCTRVLFGAVCTLGRGGVVEYLVELRGAAGGKEKIVEATI